MTRSTLPSELTLRVAFEANDYDRYTAKDLRRLTERRGIGRCSTWRKGLLVRALRLQDDEGIAQCRIQVLEYLRTAAEEGADQGGGLSPSTLQEMAPVVAESLRRSLASVERWTHDAIDALVADGIVTSWRGGYALSVAVDARRQDSFFEAH